MQLGNPLKQIVGRDQIHRSSPSDQNLRGLSYYVGHDA